MKNFTYFTEFKSYSKTSAFVAHLSEVNNKGELLKHLGAILNFPDYFGNNWDALVDCLSDFNWIVQKEIILVHDTFPKLNEHELILYVQILWEAIQNSPDGGVHNFEVVFPENKRELIERMLVTNS